MRQQLAVYKRTATRPKLLRTERLFEPQQACGSVTPDTIPRWHRQLIARKWTFTPRRPGRPGIMKATSSLILRVGTENTLVAASGWEDS